MIKKTKIEVKGLNKIFGSKQILKNVSFILDQQEHLVIIGSSGAGKSMLVKCILGLENISSGSIFFDGNLISENSDKQKVLNKLGVCFQSNALFDSYNIWENGESIVIYKRMLDSNDLIEEEIMITNLEYDQKLGLFFNEIEAEAEGFDKKENE